ncbi:hypothetical protein MACK_000834 [Theileria orientalis]|uniref:Rhodanese domain-containing protein n=1 Tax=Theileria orientalis TaxID=68886 RepID=A0A976QUB3_THEOR|nr:hypothetical protein MACK_000834 [Theileria orientalis]
MTSVEECQLLSIELDKSKSHGCLRLATESDDSIPLDEYLVKRPRWIPSFMLAEASTFDCKNNSLPFCSSMNVETSNRYSAQYIALHNFSKSSNSGSIYHSISTSAVLVIGAGGLGSPLLMYLASSGIGIIGVMDGDVVEVSNLHRQIIHDEANVGMNKAKSARDRLLKMNPNGKYISYEFFFGVKEAHEILPLYDVIVDASDNPQTKYLINDACILYNKPYVVASCIRSQGQLMVFNRLRKDVHEEKIPCFRCICPEDGNPSISFVKNACSAAGVLGSIPGILGTIQATEVLKICAGTFDTTLSPGRLLIYDAVNSRNPFRTLELSRNRDCKVCGDNAKPIRLKMYECVDRELNLERDDLAISPEEFWHIYMDSVQKGLPVSNKMRVEKDKITLDENGTQFIVYLIDVRASAHYHICHLPGSINWPVDYVLNSSLNQDSFEEKLEAITKSGGQASHNCRVMLLTICRKGISSRAAAESIRTSLSRSPSHHDTLCYSVAGGMHYLRTHLNMKIPMT